MTYFTMLIIKRLSLVFRPRVLGATELTDFVALFY